LDTKSSAKSAGPGDTLYDLLGQEVQVYVFNHKTRVWPQVYMRGAATPWRGKLASPQVEAIIQKYANMYGVDPSLVRAVVRHESGFNSQAVSPKGAQGLMQLMPGTAALMGVRNPFDPEQNVAGGVGYLRRCLDRFGHNVPLAVAAYNAGPDAVARYGTVPPYQETQSFVTSVMGTYGGPGFMRFSPYGQGKDPNSPPKAAKRKKAKNADDAEAASDTPRRPRPKIIEVRSPKKKKAEAEPEAD
jgi:hypothetical protein